MLRNTTKMAEENLCCETLLQSLKPPNYPPTKSSQKVLPQNQPTWGKISNINVFQAIGIAILVHLESSQNEPSKPIVEIPNPD